MTDTLWSPTADRIDRSALREYLNWLEVREGRPFPDHDALWAWSVAEYSPIEGSATPAASSACSSSCAQRAKSG